MVNKLAKRAAVVFIGLPTVLVLLSNTTTFKVLVATASAVALWEFQFNLAWPIIDTLTAAVGALGEARKEKKRGDKRDAARLAGRTVRHYFATLAWAICSSLGCVVACSSSTST